jgi:hypothetical protein
MADAAVPGKVFVSGPRGGEEVARFRQIVGDGPAMDALAGYAASQIRRIAMNPDGTVNPGRLGTWRRAHADALRAFPELDQRFANAARATEALTAAMDVQTSTAKLTDSLRKLAGADGTVDPAKFAAWRRSNAAELRVFPELEQRFGDAAKAGEALAAATEARNARLADYQRGIVGRLLKVEDPADVTRTVGSIFGRQDAVATMERLAKETAGDPNARDGLRKAVAEHIKQTFTGNTEAAASGQALMKSDQFQTFMRKNARALEVVFSPEEVATMKAVAADLQQANRSLVATRIPGQSNTAQDLQDVAQSRETSVLGKILLAAGGAGGAALDGVAGGLVGVLGVNTVRNMRQAGLRKVDDILVDAILNPERAKILLSKVPVRPDAGLAKRLGSLYQRAANASAAVGADLPEDEDGQGAARREPLRITVTPERRSEAAPGVADPVAEVVEHAKRPGHAAWLAMNDALAAVPVEERSALGPAVIAHLGRAGEGEDAEFDPDAFLGEWRKISWKKLEALFGGREVPEAVAEIAGATKELSRTTQPGGQKTTPPLAALGEMFPPEELTAALADPARAPEMGRWSKVYGQYWSRPRTTTPRAMTRATERLMAAMGKTGGQAA